MSNRTLEVLSSCQEAEAQRLSRELKDMQQYLEEVNDKQSIQFLNVLQGFLNHKVPKEVDTLSGMYSRAADRILNQVSTADVLTLSCHSSQLKPSVWPAMWIHADLTSLPRSQAQIGSFMKRGNQKASKNQNSPRGMM